MGRYASKNTTSSYLQLHIRDLQRKGFLRQCGWTVLTWSRGGEVVSSLGIRAEFDRVVLRYRHWRHGGDGTAQEYPVFLDSTPCNYGGTRLWFLCPAQCCSRRAAILYGGSIFACRQCHQLAYESQREAPYSRALTRAQAIRKRLGGSRSMFEEFPEKPKGMHLLTYWRLCREYEDKQNRSWPPWLLRDMGLRP